MSIDQSKLLRLTEMLAGLLEELLAPLQAEVVALRAQLDELRGREGSPPAGLGTATRPGASVAAPRPVARVAPVPRRLTRRVIDKGDCEVPGCEAPVLAKQLCETHYRIMRRMQAAGGKFDPKAQRPSGTKPVLRSCQEPGCNEPHYAKDMCRRHYMAARARARAAPRRGMAAAVQAPAATASPARSTPVSAEALGRAPAAARRAPEAAGERAGAAELAAEAEVEAGPDSEPQVTWVYAGEQPSSSSIAMPTAEVVARVVGNYRGGLGKVAEVLGRNRRDLMELLEKLNLMEHVVGVRASERQRILSAPLQERLSDLLFREKLLEDLGCLKEVDEAARRDVQARCAQLAKGCETQEDALQKLGVECGLEESGLKRLVWRYDLRRQLRDLKSKSPSVARTRP